MSHAKVVDLGAALKVTNTLDTHYQM